MLSSFKKKRGSFFFFFLNLKKNTKKKFGSFFPAIKASYFRPTHFFVWLSKSKEIVSALIGKQCLNSIWFSKKQKNNEIKKITFLLWQVGKAKHVKMKRFPSYLSLER